MSAKMLGLHGVTEIALSVRYASNDGARTLVILDEDGGQFEITFYGNTEALEALPKAIGFRDADFPKSAVERF